MRGLGITIMLHRGVQLRHASDMQHTLHMQHHTSYNTHHASPSTRSTQSRPPGKVHSIHDAISSCSSHYPKSNSSSSSSSRYKSSSNNGNRIQQQHPSSGPASSSSPPLFHCITSHKPAATSSANRWIAPHKQSPSDRSIENSDTHCEVHLHKQSSQLSRLAIEQEM